VLINIAALLETPFKPHITARYPGTPKSESGNLQFVELEKSLGQCMPQLLLHPQSTLHVVIIHNPCFDAKRLFFVRMLLYTRYSSTIRVFVQKGFFLFAEDLQLRSSEELDEDTGGE
jgi:hypothetical protein